MDNKNAIINNMKQYETFLKRELDILRDDTKQKLDNGEYPDGNLLHLKEIALESALDFYTSFPQSRLSKIKTFELPTFLTIYNDALKMKPLSPIQEEGCWHEEIPGFYTNERLQTLHKMVNSETGEVLCVDDTRFVTCNIRNLQRQFPDYKELEILMDLYPVIFPYTPSPNPITLYVDDDGTTKHVMYVHDLEGKMQPIKRVFRKENEAKWEEITKKGGQK